MEDAFDDGRCETAVNGVRVQRAQNRSDVAHCEVTSRLVPARGHRSGGDWCEAFLLGETTIALSIGDVEGHGDACHPFALVLRASIRSSLQATHDVQEALASANGVAMLREPLLTATAVVGLFELVSRSLVFANAGHPPPLIAGPGTTAFLEFSADVPLGVRPALMPRRRHVQIPPSTLLLFYTDGIIEQDRAPLRGMAELMDAARFVTNFSTVPTARDVERHLRASDANDDDIAILSLWMPPGACGGIRVDALPGR